MVLERGYADFRERLSSWWCADPHGWARTPMSRAPVPKAKAWRASTPSMRASRRSSPRTAGQASSCGILFKESHAIRVVRPHYHDVAYLSVRRRHERPWRGPTQADRSGRFQPGGTSATHDPVCGLPENATLYELE
jgi:hypothetical protein